jgi:hypothetical protein
MATAIGAHLYSSTVTVLRTQESMVDGMQSNVWKAVATGVRCRLDLSFVPISKQAPLVIESGRAPDRVGTAWFGADMAGMIRPGDRIAVTGGPIPGTFSVDQLPDYIGGYGTLDHLEIYIVEVAQALAQIQEA